MRRLKNRLANVVMLLIIIALTMALFRQWQRDADLKVHLIFLREKHATEIRMLERRHSSRATELARLKSKIDRLTSLDESTLPDQMADQRGGGSSE